MFTEYLPRQGYDGVLHRKRPSPGRTQTPCSPPWAKLGIEEINRNHSGGRVCCSSGSGPRSGSTAPARMRAQRILPFDSPAPPCIRSGDWQRLERGLISGS